MEEFWGTSGKGSVQAAVDSTARVEVATALGKDVIQVHFDLKKCHEMVSFEILYVLGMRYGFPKVVITLAINMFRAARYVNWQGSVHGKKKKQRRAC